MKIPKYLLYAIQNYYDNRAKHLLKRSAWDKETDLELISRAAHRAKLGFEASAGTFWFSTKKKTTIIRENNYQNYLLKNL